MKAYEFDGWVHNIGTKTQYNWDIVVRDNEDEFAPKEKFPQFVTFKASSKKFEKIECLNVGDKIRVKFFINGIIGVSKKTGNPYQINNLMINDIIVLEKKEVGQEQNTEPNGFELPY